MSLSDAFADAVVDVDRYLHQAQDDPWFQGSPDDQLYAIVVSVRNLMDAVRVMLDAASLNAGAIACASAFRPYDPADRQGDDDAS